MRIEKILYLTPEELDTCIKTEKVMDNLVNIISDADVIGEDITRDDIDIMIHILTEILNISKLDMEEV